MPVCPQATYYPCVRHFKPRFGGRERERDPDKPVHIGNGDKNRGGATQTRARMSPPCMARLSLPRYLPLSFHSPHLRRADKMSESLWFLQTVLVDIGVIYLYIFLHRLSFLGSSVGARQSTYRSFSLLCVVSPLLVLLALGAVAKPVKPEDQA